MGAFPVAQPNQAWTDWVGKAGSGWLAQMTGGVVGVAVAVAVGDGLAVGGVGGSGDAEPLAPAGVPLAPAGVPLAVTVAAPSVAAALGVLVVPGPAMPTGVGVTSASRLEMREKANPTANPKKSRMGVPINQTQSRVLLPLAPSSRSSMMSKSSGRDTVRGIRFSGKSADGGARAGADAAKCTRVRDGRCRPVLWAGL